MMNLGLYVVRGGCGEDKGAGPGELPLAPPPSRLLASSL